MIWTALEVELASQIRQRAMVSEFELKKFKADPDEIVRRYTRDYFRYSFDHSNLQFTEEDIVIEKYPDYNLDATGYHYSWNPGYRPAILIDGPTPGMFAEYRALHPSTHPDIPEISPEFYSGYSHYPSVWYVPVGWDTEYRAWVYATSKFNTERGIIKNLHPPAGPARVSS